MQKIYFIILLLGVNGSIYAAVNGDWQTRAAGNWNAAVWQKYVAGAWVNQPAGTYPGSTAGALTVTLNHAITLNVSPANAITDLVIGGAGTMQNASGTNTTLNVNGNVSGTGAITTNSRIYLNFKGNWSYSGTYAGNRLYLTANGAVDQTISTAITTRNFTMNKGGGTLYVTTTPTISNTTTLTAGAINYNGGNQTMLKANHPGNVIISGTGTKSTAAAMTISGTLSIGNNVILSVGGFNFTVNGSTTIGGGASGTLTFSSTTGTKTFAGRVSVNNGASWNSAVNENYTFRGGITNNGIFTAGTGTYTFNTSSQSLIGTLVIPKIDVAGVTLTNTNTLTVATTLSGTGTIRNGGTLNIGCSPSITSLDASTTTPNTVNYTGSGQTVKTPTVSYYNLTSSGTASLAGDILVENRLTVSSGTLSDAGYTLTVVENIVNNGTMSGTGKVMLSGGASNHQISGTGQFGNFELDDVQGATLTADLSFNNTLTVTTGTLTIGNATTSLNITANNVSNAGTINVGAFDAVHTFIVNNITSAGVLDLYNNASQASNLTIAGTGSTISASTELNEVLINASSDLTVNGTDLTIRGLLFNDGTVINSCAGDITINGDLINNLTGRIRGPSSASAASRMTIDGSVINDGKFGCGSDNICGNADDEYITYCPADAMYGDMGQFVDNCTQTPTCGPPAIALSSSNPSVSAASISTNSTFNNVYAFSLTISNNTATLNQVNFTTTGSLTAGEISNFKLWYNTTNNYTTAVQVGSSIIVGTGAGAHSFSTLNKSIAENITGYFWISADIAAGATIGRTLAVSAITTGDLSFTSGVLSGAAFAGGTQTIVNTFYSKANTNWDVNTTWTNVGCGGGASAAAPPTAADNVVICSGNSVTIPNGATGSCSNVRVNNGGTLSVNRGSLTVTETVQVDGTLGDNHTNGAVSLNNIIVNGTWNVTAEDIAVSGNITLNNGAAFTSGSGIYTLSGTSKLINGSIASTTIQKVSISGSYTNLLTNLIVSTTLSGLGSLTQGNNAQLTITPSPSLSTLNASATGNTVLYNGTASQTVYATTYFNLKYSNNATSNIGNVTIANNIDFNAGTLRLNGGAYTLNVLGTATTSFTGGGFSMENNSGTANLSNVTSTGGQITGTSSGSINITSLTHSSGTLTINGTNRNLNVTGATVVGSTIDISNGAGSSNSFNDITIDVAGTWNNTSTRNITISGTIQNNGTFISGTGIYILNGANKEIKGGNAVSISNAQVDGTITNSNSISLTIATALTGSGTLKNGVNKTLILTGTTTVSNLDASTNIPNLVKYNSTSTNQTIQVPMSTYYDLEVDKLGQIAYFANNTVISNNFTITNGTVDAQALTIEVKGDFSNGSSFTCNTSTIKLNGTANQQITGTTTFYNLEIDNSNVLGVVINNTISVSGLLTLTNGIVYTNANYIRMMAGSSVTEGSDLSHIDGQMNKVGNTAFKFPVGASGYYAPISMTAPSMLADEFSAKYNWGEHPEASSNFGTGVNHVSVYEWWDFETVAGGSTPNLTMFFMDMTRSSITDLATLIYTHFDGSEWVRMGTNTGVDLGGGACSITGTGFTSYSPQSPGSSSSSNPLPIELFSFKAIQEDEQTVLLWITASETNNDFFTLEKSVDGVNFIPISIVNGVGTSNCLNTYSVSDNSENSQIVYYRLKQTDFDGAYTYSNIIAVEATHKKESEISLSIYPNPAHGSEGVFINILDVELNEIIDIQIVDLTGRIVEYGRVMSNSDNVQHYVNFNSQLAAGTYFVKFAINNRTITEKLIIH